MSCLARPTSVLIGILVTAAFTAAQPHHHGTPTDNIGHVSLTTSCTPAVTEEFNRGVALLHSFWFPEAIRSFDRVLEQDPGCAMAWWGKAMSYWGNPYASSRPAEALKNGATAVVQARALQPPTARERAYVEAVAQLYEHHESRPNGQRTLAYEQAMAALHARYPDDSEAAIFYALALTQTAAPTDKSYTNLRAAGAILEQQLSAQPDHPGITHYIIHSYDVPALAEKALEAARRYARIAPAVPHALHMPSHTFTRVGLWEESIATNLASAAAARTHGSTAEELHALDYQVYAYLQTTQDEAASQVAASIPQIVARLDTRGTASAAPSLAGHYAAAAIPARYALERGRWAEAATLALRPTTTPFADAVTAFARAIGAARSGQPTEAQADLTLLLAKRDELIGAGEDYWANQVDIASRAATAWVRFASGDREQAIAEMRDTAAREAATEKSGISPGPIAPARELLAEMLLEAGRTAEAREEFEATLRTEPLRFRSLYGAARTASLMNDHDHARTLYARLVEVCEPGDRPGRQELQHARRALNATP